MKNIKTIMTIVSALLVISFVTGCLSTPAETPAPTPKAKEQEKTVLGWKGQDYGSDKPEWVADALDGDFSSLPESVQKKLEGKKTVVCEAKGTDLELAKEWATNFGLNVGIARELTAAVDARFNGALSKNEKSQKTLVASVAKAKFTGFEKVTDTWVLNRTVDNRKKNFTDEYSVVMVYAIDQELFEKNAQKYIANLIGELPDSADMKKAEGMADELAKELAKEISAKPGLVASNDVESNDLIIFVEPLKD